MLQRPAVLVPASRNEEMATARNSEVGGAATHFSQGAEMACVNRLLEDIGSFITVKFLLNVT